MVRAFIALPVSDLLRSELTVMSRCIEATDKKGCWRLVPADNFHLTLAFLGDVDHSMIQLLGDEMARRFKHSRRGQIELAEVGLFPFNRKPKLIVALLKPTDWLMDLYQSVQQMLTSLGLSVDKKSSFKPHVTLARLRDKYGKAGRFEPQMTTGSFKADQLVLYQSELKGKHPLYTLLYGMRLV